MISLRYRNLERCCSSHKEERNGPSGLRDDDDDDVDVDVVDWWA